MTQINKIMKVVKDQFFMLALLATFIGFSAFKYAERSNTPEDGWYEVLTDPSDPSNESLQQIGDKLDEEPPQSGLGCTQANSGHRCAVKLEFDNGATAIPPTVADIDSYDANMTGDASEPL